MTGAQRIVLSTAALLALASSVSAVAFTADFEKTLDAQLLKLKHDLQAYPDLEPVVDGVPMDVAAWKALSCDETVAKLTLFSIQKADELRYLFTADAANADKISAFARDGHELVMAIAGFLESLSPEDNKDGGAGSSEVLAGESDTTSASPLPKAPVVNPAAPASATSGNNANVPAPSSSSPPASGITVTSPPVGVPGSSPAPGTSGSNPVAPNSAAGTPSMEKPTSAPASPSATTTIAVSKITKSNGNGPAISSPATPSLPTKESTHDTTTTKSTTTTKTTATTTGHLAGVSNSNASDDSGVEAVVLSVSDGETHSNETNSSTSAKTSDAHAKATSDDAAAHLTAPQSIASRTWVSATATTTVAATAIAALIVLV